MLDVPNESFSRRENYIYSLNNNNNKFVKIKVFEILNLEERGGGERILFAH